MVTLTFDPKINRVFPLPQGNHVAKFGKDSTYRTKIIVRKLSCGRGKILFILGSKVKVTVTINIEFLTTGSFPHDNFSSVYWIFTKLDHMIPLWKGKKPIYFWGH
jgi:hypothetical protein